MKDLWLAMLVIVVFALVLGTVFSLCIFIHRVWQHVNKSSETHIGKYINFQKESVVVNIDEKAKTNDGKYVVEVEVK